MQRTVQHPVSFIYYKGTEGYAVLTLAFLTREVGQYLVLDMFTLSWLWVWFGLAPSSSLSLTTAFLPTGAVATDEKKTRLQV